MLYWMAQTINSSFCAYYEREERRFTLKRVIL